MPLSIIWNHCKWILRSSPSKRSQIMCVDGFWAHGDGRTKCWHCLHWNWKCLRCDGFWNRNRRFGRALRTIENMDSWPFDLGLGRKKYSVRVSRIQIMPTKSSSFRFLYTHIWLISKIVRKMSWQKSPNPRDTFSLSENSYSFRWRCLSLFPDSINLFVSCYSLFPPKNNSISMK